MSGEWWIKIPGPGEFRGKGTWVKAEDSGYNEGQIEDIKSTNFLPVEWREND